MFERKNKKKGLTIIRIRLTIVTKCKPKETGTVIRILLTFFRTELNKRQIINKTYKVRYKEFIFQAKIFMFKIIE